MGVPEDTEGLGKLPSGFLTLLPLGQSWGECTRNVLLISSQRQEFREQNVDEWCKVLQ